MVPSWRVELSLGTALSASALTAISLYGHVVGIDGVDWLLGGHHGHDLIGAVLRVVLLVVATLSVVRAIERSLGLAWTARGLIGSAVALLTAALAASVWPAHDAWRRKFTFTDVQGFVVYVAAEAFIFVPVLGLATGLLQFETSRPEIDIHPRRAFGYALGSIGLGLAFVWGPLRALLGESHVFFAVCALVTAITLCTYTVRGVLLEWRRDHLRGWPMIAAAAAIIALGGNCVDVLITHRRGSDSDPSRAEALPRAGAEPREGRTAFPRS